MTMRTCDKCGKDFRRKDMYDRHMSRVYPCTNESKINNYDEKIKRIEEQLEHLNIVVKELILTNKNLQNQINERKNIAL